MILLYLVARNADLANEFRGLHLPQTAAVAGGDSWRDCFAMVVKICTVSSQRHIAAASFW
jgi:hypothetical protein